MVLKLDLVKEFDRVNWSFLRLVLLQIGIPGNYVSWIMGCVELANFVVLINGTPSTFFPVSKGIRQGCPLSPLLFILVIEGLSLLISQAHSAGVFLVSNLPHSSTLLTFFLLTMLYFLVLVPSLNGSITSTYLILSVVPLVWRSMLRSPPFSSITLMKLPNNKSSTFYLTKWSSFQLVLNTLVITSSPWGMVSRTGDGSY